MATFKLVIGGTGQMNLTDDEYTSQVIRCGYKKNLNNDGMFDVIIDGVTKAGDGGKIKLGNNIFYIVRSGSINRLLFKGIIDKVTWSGKNRCMVSGRQCMRGTSGAKGTLQDSKTPSLMEQVESKITDLLNNTTLYSNAQDVKESGTGEGKRQRGW